MGTKLSLSADRFKAAMRDVPLIAIDLVLRDPDAKVLVGYRRNEPAKNYWFVPGSRVGKDERLADAFGRIVKLETGLDIAYSKAKLLGAYDHIYPNNFFGDPEFGAHYVVIAMRVDLDARPEITMDDQHSDIRWMSAEEILAAPDVHAYTKAYFRGV